MLYRKIPKTGDEISILGFGCMRLPLKDEKIDEERATRQIHMALDRGVNYLDTAWPYHAGESEPFLGRALAGGRREKVRIATKLPSWLIENREDMDKFLNAQLEKLNTDRVDYYLVHNLNGRLWDHLLEHDVMDFLDKARADGRIVNTGFSFHGVLPDFKRIVDARPWEICQIQYNFLDEENQAGAEGLRYAASKNLGVIIMEPLRGGNLGLVEPPPAVDAVWKEAPRARTPVEWALRWVWNHPEVASVLSGMNEEAHVEENLAIAERAHPDSLTEEELALVRRAAEKYKSLMKVGCTGCGYCKPCPAGVNIPGCFEVYNKFHMFGSLPESKVVYAIRMSGMTTGEPGYASQCEQCGECVEKCPQGLEIPDLLEKVVDELEGPDLEKCEAIGRQILNL
ncbi:MAG: aldo/keto reductase [Desulfobacterales bacterium]|nr:aldo/keto reductase [Desulfobacterales bacterium]